MTVGLFSRGKNKQDAADPGATPELDDSLDDGDDTDDLEGLDGPDGVDGVAEEVSVPTAGDEGPFDRAHVDGDTDYLNLGSIWLRGQQGMELRLEVNEQEQQITGVTAVIGESAVQLQAFAAPKTEGVWIDIRNEIAASITESGGTAEIVTGPFGQELLTRMPQAGPDGRTVFMPARFVGVDGPRWFLRAVVSGRAAIEPDAATDVHDVIRTAVIDRGEEAMPPRELLPLRLPEVPDADQATAPDEAQEAENGPADLADLKPFQRGPEITEVR